MVSHRRLPLHLKSSQKAAIIYHDIFSFPLTGSELNRWSLKIDKLQKQIGYFNSLKIAHHRGFYFVKGKPNLIKIRLQNKKYSLKKIKIAKRVAKLLKNIPTILFIGLTGSVAMQNSKKNSDIDLMIITKSNSLWTTRLIVYLTLAFYGFKFRRFQSKIEKDRLCLNIWLDENELVWSPKNIFTAHELAQIKPLVNKNKTYQKLLYKNKWILTFWPNSIKISKAKNLTIEKLENFKLIENFAFRCQYLYMKPKVTNEVVTSKKALFHPQNLSKKILKKLKFSP